MPKTFAIVLHEQVSFVLLHAVRTESIWHSCDLHEYFWAVRIVSKHCTKRNYPLKVDRVTLKWYVMWYIALHILLDNFFLHILTPHLP